MQVLRGGQKDLDVQIITPNGMMLYDKQRANNDEVTFTPQNGEFRFCFSNEFSQLTDKVGSRGKRRIFRMETVPVGTRKLRRILRR